MAFDRTDCQIILFTSIYFFCSEASALPSGKILTSESFDNLCVGSMRGAAAVDPDRLAAELVGRASITFELLDGANSSGTKDGVVGLVSDRNTPSEPAFAVRQLLLDPGTGANVSGVQSFGPAVDYRSAKIVQAMDALQESIEKFALEINQGSKINDGNIVYRIVEADGQEVDLSNDIFPDRLFIVDPTLIIVCERSAAGGITPQSGALSETTPQEAKWSPANLLRLRGDVASLVVPQKDLADSEPARIGVLKDYEADSRTITLDGVVGIALQHPDGDWQAIPFLSYQRTETDGDSDDINALKPGVVASWAWSSTEAALRAVLEGSYLYDIEQDARVGNLVFNVDPAIATSVGPLFGGYLTPVGPLRFRPELRLTAKSGWIFEEGNDGSEFQGSQSFAGLGGILSLQARLDYGQPWSDFQISAGLENLRVVAGDLDRNDIKRWTAGLSYAPKNFPYLGLGFNVADGDNPDTLQREKYYRIGVDLRY